MANFPSWPEWPEAELAVDVPAFNGGEVVPAGTRVTVVEWIGFDLDSTGMVSFRVRAPRDPSRVYEEALERRLRFDADGRAEYPPLVEAHVIVEVDPEALRAPAAAFFAPPSVVSV